MDTTATLEAPCDPDDLFAWVGDLSCYPRWLSIVARAEPAVAVAGDPGLAWSVDLRGRIGPLARSKRLRMVRSTYEPDRLVVFERREADARSHSPWVLRADVAPSPAGALLEMRLHYGGQLWGPVLERLVRDEIDASRGRLLELLR
ncbi:MAG: SRPBCC family protein [Acidimicrobiia bacterium]